MFVNRSISGRMGQVILSMAFFGALTVTVTRAQTPSTAFTQPFNWTTKKLIILPSLNQGLFKVGEPVTLFTSNNIPVTVYDLYGRTVYAGAPTTRNFAVGHYFVECNGDRNQFAVLPNDYAGVSYLGDQAYPGFLTGTDRQRRIQPGWARGGAASWRVVQPTIGAWDWSTMDRVITNNLGRKLMVIANVENPPEWVQPANLISNYVAYLTALTERYLGRITAIEIWNEPAPNMFWGDPYWIKILADLHVAGSAAIKAVDPSIQVLGPSFSSPGSAGLTATLAEYGFSPRIDGLSWHDYWAYSFPPDQPVLQDGKLAPDVFGRGQAYRDAAGFSGPLFITEMGLFGRSALGIPTPPIDPGYTGGIITNAPDWSLGMTRGVKYAVMYRAAGAAMIMAHLLSLEDTSLNDPQNALYGWEYGQRGPKPKTTAFLMAGYWLDGAELRAYRTPGGQMVLSAWRRADNTSVVFAWAGERQSFALSNPAALTMTDLFGNPLQVNRLGDQPIIFHSPSGDAASLLQSVMARLPALNQTPVPVFLPNHTVFKDQLLEFTIKATDPDHDPIVYSASSLPVGASLNPSTGVFSWTPTAQQLGQYAVTITATDARGLSASTSTLISVLGSSSDGLIGWWKLDESSGMVAADSAGASTGNLVGVTTGFGWVTGRIGNGRAFDGASNYLDFDSNLLAVTNNFTIAAWINPRQVTQSLGVFFALRSRYAKSGIKLGINTRSDLFIEGQTAAGLQQIYHALGRIQYDTWQHIVVVYDKSNFAVYINGERFGPAHGANGSWDGDLVMDPSGVTRIGAEGGSVANFFFDGLIDDVRLYKRTLSATEVTALYHWTGTDRPRPPSNLTVVTP
jgi:hypothetical protein